VQSEPAQPTLLLDFAQIDASTSKVGRWLMSTTLVGRFSEFTAEYTHDDALGGALTSLIESVTPHELVKDVRVDLNGRDAVRDFLALDINTYRTYESNGTDTLVIDRSLGATLSAQPGDLYLLNFTPSTLPAYVHVPDASRGTLRIAGASRVNDGSALPLENVWLSKVRQATGTGFDYLLNLFDARGSGSYLISFENVAQASLSGAVYRDLNNNGIREVGEPGVAACEVRLQGSVGGNTVDTIVQTNASGEYSFTTLQSSTYALTVGAMPGLENGIHATGAAGGTITPTGVVDLSVPAGSTLSGYQFAKLSTSPDPQADTAVVLSTLTPSVTINEETTVRINIKNRGPDPAAGTLNFVIDSGLAVVSLSATQGTVSNGVWNFGSLQVQQEAALTVVVRPTRSGTFAIVANLNAGPDPDASNNSGQLSISANASGDLDFEDGFESNSQASASPVLQVIGSPSAEASASAGVTTAGNPETILSNAAPQSADLPVIANQPALLSDGGFEAQTETKAGQ